MLDCGRKELDRTMFERFTDRARRAIVLAQEEARLLNHNYIGTEHILLGLLAEGEGVAAISLKSLGVTLADARTKVEELMPRGKAPATGHIPFTPRAKALLESSLREALDMDHRHIGTEHMLLSTVGDAEGVATRVLHSLGVDPEDVSDMVRTLLARESGTGPTVADQAPPEPVGTGGGIFRGVLKRGESKGGALAAFGTDLNAAARDGKLDPVVGRDAQIERVLQVLLRRTKNNPVLVGEPGVGKTAIVEGMAQAILAGDVPPELAEARIVSLDMGSIVAGSRYRGDFEERMKKIIQEIRRDPNIIIFLDEIHTLVGAGGAEGAIDASSILKPMMARGELRIIGATTFDEYRKYVESDAALERRFAPVEVPEPTVEETIGILRGLRDRYESHHDVRYGDDALELAATLAARYISDRFLPDKAIDVIDEAGARLRIGRIAVVPERVKELDERIALVVAEKTSAIDAQAFERAASLRDDEMELRRQREQAIVEARQEANQSDGHRVTTDMIADIVASISGVPVTQMTEAETERLRKMELTLQERVVGQQEAIKVLSRALRRTRAGLKDPKRPSGSFIFAGPSGVGKTELSKALAEFLFGTDEALISIDMSEFGDKHTASRLFGAPPGFVGYDDGGELTEKVRRKPFSVILFDEVEKAHPDIFNTLLQVLDEGRLTDGQGRVVDFKNTVIIMTTNLGSRDFASGISVGFTDDGVDSVYERMVQTAKRELKSHFRPEFLNRVDETVVFRPLAQADLLQIVDIMLRDLAERCDAAGWQLHATLEARRWLAERGWDAALGARPLRRAIQRYAEDPLSEHMLMRMATRVDAPSDAIPVQLDVSLDGAELVVAEMPEILEIETSAPSSV